MARTIFLTLFTLMSLSGFSVSIDTITNKIIVLNEGYDRVSAIKTSKGIVVIDTHKSTRDMSRVRKQIIDYFNDSTFVYVINTHPCLEHINGNSLFPEAQKIAHANFTIKPEPDSLDNRIAFLNTQIPELENKINQSRDVEEQQELKNKLDYYSSIRNDFFKSAIPPDISFTDEMTLCVGDITFEMTYIGEGAHGNSSILIYIPEEKTLFTGSALSLPPIIYKSGAWFQKQDVERWISMLDRFIGITDLKNIVASHVKYYTKTDLIEMRDYYQLISQTIQQNKKEGISKEKTFQTLSYEVIDNQFNVFSSESDNRERHENNIEILWEYYK